MHRAISNIGLAILLVMSFCFPDGAFAASGKRLLTINGTEYTNEDFKNWWSQWNDKNSLPFPTAPDDFIAFQLMVQQGLEMGYNNQPDYIRKLEVFLRVKAMMALKYEEIDSKAAVTEADLRKYFDLNHSTVWELQILAFDSEAKAQKAYQLMLPFKGQSGGQLVFADLIGAAPEEKADTYDVVKVSAADFTANKKESWLTVVRELAPGEVCQPFLNKDNNKYILLRLVKIEPAKEGLFEEKRAHMSGIVAKANRNRLTSELIGRLKKKYNVRIDQELVDSIKFDEEYPPDFLKRPLISTSGFEATVKDLIFAAKKEKELRKNLSDEILKDLSLNSIVADHLIKYESLARGYENRPPLLPIYEFYKQNRLRTEVEAGLQAGIKISDQDIIDYFNSHIADFTVQEKIIFFLLKGDEDVLKTIWVGTMAGGDFVELAQKYSLDANIQKMEVISLAPEVGIELKKLDKGGVSVPFAFDGKYGLLKLVDRVPGKVASLEQVKTTVVEQLKKQKFALIKDEYLTKLKSRSKIDINQGVWNDLERELGNGKKD